jgi:hypothetical protein
MFLFLCRLARCRPQNVFTHYDAFAIRAHDQEIRNLPWDRRMRVEGVKVRADFGIDLLELTLGNLSCRFLPDAFQHSVEGLVGYLTDSQELKPLGVFAGGKIELAVEWKQAIPRRDL